MSTPALRPYLITHHRRGRHPLRLVGLFINAAAAIAHQLDVLDQAGATEAGRISARVLA